MQQCNTTLLPVDGASDSNCFRLDFNATHLSSFFSTTVFNYNNQTRHLTDPN